MKFLLINLSCSLPRRGKISLEKVSPRLFCAVGTKILNFQFSVAECSRSPIFNFQFLILLLLASCHQETPPVTLDFTKLPYEKLSDYHFFKGEIQDLLPNDRVLPYTLNSTLFTDYAHKARLIWMPVGATANYTPTGVLDFPNQTVLIKSFYYPKDFSKPSENKQIIETRLLVKDKGVWASYNYVWNENMTEASLDIVGDTKKVEWKDEKGIMQHANYVIPNKNQCKSCHNYNETLQPIGPKARNLNLVETGGKNQLTRWAEKGYLTGLDVSQQLPKMAQWENAISGNLQERALAYLDINCGHCHNPNGPGGSSGLTLTYEEQDLHKIGLCKSPIAAGSASGGFLYDIQAGKPDSSILLHRMVSTNPGEMMPEVGRTMMHVKGIELIRKWIEGMEGECR